MAWKGPNPRNKRSNPNSLANLRPARKGEPTRNPSGGHNGALMRIRRLAPVEVAEIGSMILEQNVYELKQIVDDARGEDKEGNPNSKHSALKVWVATIALRGILKGDPYALDALLTRIMGKPFGAPSPEETNSPALGGKPPITPEERDAKIAQYQKLLMETEPESNEKPIIDITPVKDGAQ